MKVIETRPPHRERCKKCNSLYDIELEDVWCRDSIESDCLGNTKVMMWNCPVCADFNRVVASYLPLNWVHHAKAPIIP